MDKNKLTLIGGIIFAVLSVWQLGKFIKLVSYEYYVFGIGTITSILILASFIMLAVAMLTKKNNALVLIGTIILAVVSLFVFIRGFFVNAYSEYESYLYSYGGYYEFNLLYVIPSFVEVIVFIAIALMGLIMGTKALAEYRTKIKNLWFVPGLGIVALLIVALLVGLISGWDWYSYDYFYRFNVVYWLAQAAGFICLGAYIVDPESINIKKPELGANGNAKPASTPVVADGYVGMAKHILLLIFTFGIWLLIWIYRTTAFLNNVEGEQPRSATSQLLLCMFVPFYWLYWIYKSAQRIDKMALRKGIASDTAVLCLILAIFIGIVPPILMQDKINAIATAGGTMGYGGAQPQAPVQPAPAQPAPEAPVQPQAPAAEAAPKVDVVSELKAYKELLDAGIITQEEFEAKKNQLLNA